MSGHQAIRPLYNELDPVRDVIDAAAPISVSPDLQQRCADTQQTVVSYLVAQHSLGKLSLERSQGQANELRVNAPSSLYPTIAGNSGRVSVWAMCTDWSEYKEADLTIDDKPFLICTVGLAVRPRANSRQDIYQLWCSAIEKNVAGRWRHRGNADLNLFTIYFNQLRSQPAK